MASVATGSLLHAAESRGYPFRHWRPALRNVADRCGAPRGHPGSSPGRVPLDGSTESRNPEKKPSTSARQDVPPEESRLERRRCYAAAMAIAVIRPLECLRTFRRRNRSTGDVGKTAVFEVTSLPLASTRSHLARFDTLGGATVALSMSLGQAGLVLEHKDTGALREVRNRQHRLYWSGGIDGGPLPYPIEPGSHRILRDDAGNCQTRSSTNRPKNRIFAPDSARCGRVGIRGRNGPAEHLDRTAFWHRTM